jgi:hypothetical protein
MPRTSESRHDAKTLRLLADQLAKLAANTTDLATEYEAHVGDGSLPVLKDDQRKRAMGFLNRFLAEARQSLFDHLEESGSYQASGTAVEKVVAAPSDRPRRRVVRAGERKDKGAG